MAKETSMLHIAVDDQLQEKASWILAGMGLTIPDVVQVLLTRIVADEGLPAGLVDDIAGYEEWFKAKIQEALDDPRPARPFDEVMQEMRARIAEKRSAP